MRRDIRLTVTGILLACPGLVVEIGVIVEVTVAAAILPLVQVPLRLLGVIVAENARPEAMAFSFAQATMPLDAST